MTLRLLSFAVWALVSASAVFWVTRLLSTPAPAPAHAVTAGQSIATASADLSRVLGVTRINQPAAAPEVVASSRFKLVGLVAAKVSSPQSGLALIAIDGKPPRPVGLGGVVDGSLVLLAVNHRRAEIGPSGGAATVTLELPAVPEPNRSARLSPAPALPGAVVPVPSLPVPVQSAPPPPPQPPVSGTPRMSAETR